MVQLITTTRILSALEAIPTSDRKDLNLPSNPSLDSPITHDQLIRLSRYFRSENATSNPDDARTLNSLLHGTKVYVPPPPPKPKPVRLHLLQTIHTIPQATTTTTNIDITYLTNNNTEPRVPRPKSPSPSRLRSRHLQPNDDLIQHPKRPITDLQFLDTDRFGTP